MVVLYHWQRFAGCKNLPREWFFDHERDQRHTIPEQAKRACDNCAVNASCFEHALTYEMYGYWAGTTKGQRVRIRRKLGIQIKSSDGMNRYHDGEWLIPK